MASFVHLAFARLRIRQELNAKGEGAYKLSVNDFIIKAAALALQKKPTCNSAWLGDFIRRYLGTKGASLS